VKGELNPVGIQWGGEHGPCTILFCALITVKLGAGTHPLHHEPRTFKSHIYILRLICTCSVAQALSIPTFRFRKDVELTKLFKIVYRVVFRSRRPDFRDFEKSIEARL
jgi:hypothetical protein